jgi:hypothetical protein
MPRPYKGRETGPTAIDLVIGQTKDRRPTFSGMDSLEAAVVGELAFDDAALPRSTRR